MQKLLQYSAEQLVFLDESGINKNGERRYGYGPKGQRVSSKADGGKTPNISILPVFSLDGYIAIGACEGAVDGELYYHFIKDKVIPECTPFPGPRSVLIMDNAKIHVGEVQISVKLKVVLIVQEIHRLIRGTNMRFEYLPPYSPDYNPIEFTFSAVFAISNNLI